MDILGITGSFGTGKSTVAAMFESLGAKVIDADKIVTQLIHSSGLCFRPIVRAFGKEILEGKEIDRRLLARIVFDRKNGLKRLNAIIHPPVIREIKKRLKQLKGSQKFRFVIIDAPLLIEVGLNKEVGTLIVVKANREKQIERLTRRMKISKGHVLRRIKMQMSIKEKINMADIVIDNRGKRRETLKQVKEIWRKLQRRK